MKKLLFILFLLLGAISLSAQGLKTTVDEDRKAEIRKTLALDYSMPDYSISKINSKVMGKRLVEILDKFQEMSLSQTNMRTLSIIQAKQIDGMLYCAVKNVKLNKVVKQDNVITITYDTELAENAKKIKNSQLVFSFVDGISNDIATNNFFTNVCRYIKE